MFREQRIQAKQRKLRHALRDLDLDEKDNRYVDHYAGVWDEDTLGVIIGWLEQARRK